MKKIKITEKDKKILQNNFNKRPKTTHAVLKSMSSKILIYR